LFEDAEKCAKCGAVNPAYEPPRWRKLAPLVGVVIAGLVAGLLLGPLGYALVSMPVGAILLRKNGAGVIALWLGGNVAILLATFLLSALVPVAPVVVTYAVLAVALLPYESVNAADGRERIGDPGGIRTLDLHLERVTCWASALQGRKGEATARV
jgi:hypothetical protein